MEYFWIGLSVAILLGVLYFYYTVRHLKTYRDNQVPPIQLSRAPVPN